MTLSPDFLMLSPESAHPRDVPLAVMIDEAARELAGRRKVYPDFIAKCRLTPIEAAHEIATMAAIGADLRMAQACWKPNGAPFAPDTSASWTAKVKTLRRELAIRRASYPGWIAKGRMIAATAHAQMERMEAIHWLYWVDAMFWLPEGDVDEKARLDLTRAFMRDHLPAYHTACAQRADTTERWPDGWQNQEQAA